nr:MAG TPA: hypothetical protein [Caudoviricetes sp.]
MYKTHPPNLGGLFLSVIIDIQKIVYYNRKKLEYYVYSLSFTIRPKNRPKM